MTILDVIGTICKVVLPIPEEQYIGNPDSHIAVCTLSSIDLLKRFKDSQILNHICIAGRLLSENKGIDVMLDYLYKNKNVKIIIICGKEVWGHKAGHSLFELHKNGIKSNRIIGSQSPDPTILSSDTKIRHFQQNIQLVNLINETDLDLICSSIQSFASLD